MLFDGPGGWKVEPGWWKRTPAEFEDQLHWCEMCSGCLDVPQRIANDERDDITPQMYERLKSIGSPKIAKSMYVVHDPKTFDKTAYHTFTGGSDYINAAGGLRTTNKNRDYYPRNFLYIDSLNFLPFIIESKKADDWIILSENGDDSELAYKYFSNVVINPGCIYLTDTNVAVFNVRAKSLRWLFDKSRTVENFSLGDLLNCYPMDKIVKVKLSDAFYEKNRADCLADIKLGQKIALVGSDFWSKKLFLRMMDDSIYIICGWFGFEVEKIFYPIMPIDYEVLHSVDYVIVAYALPKLCNLAEEILKKRGIPAEKILKFNESTNCEGC